MSRKFLTNIDLNTNLLLNATLNSVTLNTHSAGTAAGALAYSSGRIQIGNGSAAVSTALSTDTITVGSTAITIGGSATTIAGLSSVTSTTFVGALTGNASTATSAATLTTARNINGVSFNGSADITVTAAAGTLSGNTLNSGVTASSLTSVGTLTTLTTSGNVTIGGDLTVNGTTTTINSTTITVDDKNLELGAIASPTDTSADGAGITVKGATDKTFNWVNATAAWTSSEDLNLLTGKVYEIAGTTVLSATALGSGVVGSSLTSVGTIATGTWNATTIATNKGGTGLTSFTSGGAVYATSTSALTTGTLPVSAGGTGITAFGTGVATALGVNVGSAGALVTFNGALGTPSSGTLTNATGLPVSTGISGLGTSVATALAVAVGSAGAVVTNGGALGTPSSGTLTNATGLPIGSGVSGLGTGVATFLGTPTSANLRAAISDESGTGAIVFAGGDIGAATATTATAGNSSTLVATTAFVANAVSASGTKKYTATNSSITPSSGTATWSIPATTHLIGNTPAIQIQMFQVSDGMMVDADFKVDQTAGSSAPTGDVTISWNASSTVSAATYRIVLIG
jgi:hypothetical protein